MLNYEGVGGDHRVLRIKFRGEKKRFRDLVLLSREDPANVATRILAAVLLGEPGIMDLAERFTSVKSFESENPIDVCPIMDVDYCALPFVPSIPRSGRLFCTLRQRELL